MSLRLSVRAFSSTPWRSARPKPTVNIEDINSEGIKETAPKKRGPKPRLKKVVPDESARVVSEKAVDDTADLPFQTFPPVFPHLAHSGLDKLELPQPREWRSAFPTNYVCRDRISICNPVSAAAIADAFITGKDSGQVIIEAFPGPGALTRALMTLPKERIRKIIVLEDYEPYLEYLRPLEKIDSRVSVIPLDGAAWSTYQTIEEMQVLQDIQISPWQKVHPHLQFVSHLRNSVHGEQLLSQFLRCIPVRSFLFRYGRVPINLLMTSYVASRLVAPSQPPKRAVTAKSKAPISHPVGAPKLRCKLSVVGEATASIKMKVPEELTTPYNAHWHPAASRSSILRSDSRRPEPSWVGMRIIPLVDQAITPDTLDKWDFCLRRLFVLKGNSLRRALPSLAPGGGSLVPLLSKVIDVDKEVRKLEVAEWAEVLRVFGEWAFAPDELLITEAFNPQAEE